MRSMGPVGLALLIAAVAVLAACALPVHRWLDRRADTRWAVRQAEQATREDADRIAWESLVARLNGPRKDSP